MPAAWLCQQHGCASSMAVPAAWLLQRCWQRHLPSQSLSVATTECDCVPTGRRNCFHSIAEIAACLDGQARAAGLRIMYIATNADVREQAMLRAGITAAVVLFWQDVEGVLVARSNGKAHMGGCFG